MIGKRATRSALGALGIAVTMGLCGTARAEERSARNSVFLEGLGPGLAYSINYERLLLSDLGVRAGFSYLSVSASSGTATGSASWIAIPVTIDYIGIGSGNSALEVGAGASIINASGSGTSLGVSATGQGTIVWGTAHLGYRRQPPDGGFQFRVGAAALFGEGLALSSADPTKVGIIPWFYLSLGWTF